MANSITLQVQFQNTAAIADIQNLNQAIASVGAEAARTGAATTVAFNQATRASDDLQQSISGLGQAFAALQIVKLASDLAMLGDEMARLRRFFELNTGDLELFNALDDVAKRTHFAFVDLAKDAQLLVNVGKPLKEIPGTIETLAQRVRMAGGDQQTLNNLVRAFATISAKTFIETRQLAAQFMEAGLIPMQLLTKALGVSTQELRASQKQLNVQNVLTLLQYQAQLDVQQSGIADRTPLLTEAVNDLNTAWSKLADVMYKDFGEAAVLTLRFIIQLVQGFTKLLELIEKLPDWMKTAIGFIGELGIALGTLITIGRALKTVLSIGTWLAAPELRVVLTVLAGIAATLWGINEAIKDTKKEVKGAPDLLTKKQHDDAAAGLLDPNVKALENAAKQAADLIDQANKHYYTAGKESIEALSFVYEEHFRKIGLTSQLSAQVRIAYERDVAAEVKKYGEQVSKEILRSQRAVEAAQQHIEETQQTMEPDDTFAGRQRDALIHAQTEETRIRAQFFDQIYEKQQAAAKQSAAASKAGFGALASAYELNYLAEKVQLDKQADTEVAKFQVDEEKKALALIRQYEKQLRDEQLQDTLSAIDRVTKLRTAVISTIIPANRNEQIAQINAATNAQIQGIQETHDAQVKALEEERELYNDLHPLNLAGQFETQQRINRQISELSKNSNTEIQLDRISAWKSANQIIIEQQKEMFDSIKGVLDKIWDAALDKSKSFWHSLGTIIKDTITSIFKTIVTNRVAGGLASALGFGPFAYGTGYDALRAPVPLGRQSPFQMPAADQSRSVFKALAGALSPGSTAGPAGSGSMAPATTPEGQAQQQVSNQITDLARQVNSTAATVQATAPSSWDLSGYGGGAGGGGYSGGEGGSAVSDSDHAWAVSTASAGAGLGSSQQTAIQSARAATAATSLKDSFNIGKPIWVDNGEGGVKSIPWGQASASAQLGAIVKSPGFNTALLGTGAMMALQGFTKGTTGGLVQGVAGSTAAGIGAAGLFSGLGLSAIGGGALGAGAGLLAAGLIHGGKVGLGLDIGGGALTGAVIGTMILPGIGTALGAGIGAAAGAIAGGIRMLIPGMDQQIRSGVKRLYGVDITDKAIRDQIATIVKNNYGGSLSVGLYSLEVQNLVRLYAATTGQQAGLPRPMYGVAQAQQGGQLQTQPVYSSGQLVQNPYTGTTTYQYAQQGMYMQLDPNQAMQLFSGQVVNVVQNNPATIAQANATALAAGNARYATLGSLVEPSTVMA